jgi:hypothetical protein
MAGNAANSIRKAGRCHSSVIFIATCYETSNEPESPDLPFLTSLRDSLSPPRRAAGLFLCHAPCGQVMAHFERLRHESRDLVDWTLVPDEGHFNDPRGDEPYPHQSLSMPRRFAQARALGRLTDGAGLMDIAIMPRVLAAQHEFVWALEYDVDYSGHWSKLFKRFARNRADILTTTLLPRPRNADWALWATARAPACLPHSAWFRSFNPLLRLSRRFAAAYIAAANSGDWDGHYEFIIPTVGRHLGFRVEDMATAGVPPWRRPLYHNTPADPTLSPGTFVWRPARHAYFHQQPAEFAEPDRLYHPVKPA